MYVYEEIRYSIESSHIKKKGNSFQIKKPDIFYIFSFSYLGKTHFHPTYLLAQMNIWKHPWIQLITIMILCLKHGLGKD